MVVVVVVVFGSGSGSGSENRTSTWTSAGAGLLAQPLRTEQGVRSATLHRSFFGLPRIDLEGKLLCILNDFHKFDITRKVSIFALDFDASLHHACFFRLLIIHLEGKLQCIFNDFH